MDEEQLEQEWERVSMALGDKADDLIIEQPDAAEQLLADTEAFIAAWQPTATATKSWQVALKAAPAGPPNVIDAALDRLRLALDGAAAKVGDRDLAALVDALTAQIAPATGGHATLTDTSKPVATKSAPPATFAEFLLPGLRQGAPAPVATKETHTLFEWLTNFRKG